MLHITTGRIVSFVLAAVFGSTQILMQQEPEPSVQTAATLMNGQPTDRQELVVDGQHLLAYCLCYEDGLSREQTVVMAAEHYLETLPEEFWDIQGMTKKEQAIFVAMNLSDVAVNHVCPSHQDKQFTPEEYNVLLPPPQKQQHRKHQYPEA